MSSTFNVAESAVAGCGRAWVAGGAPQVPPD